MPRDALFAPRIPRWTAGALAVAALAVAATGARVASTRDTAVLAVPPATTVAEQAQTDDTDNPVTGALSDLPSPSGSSAAASAPAESPAEAESPAAAAGRALAPVSQATPPAADPVTPPAPQSTSAQPAARTQPTVGSYPATMTGTAELNGSPQKVGPTGTLDIDQLTGSDQHQTTTGGPADLDLTLRYHATSAKLVTLKLSAGGITKTVQPTSPVQFLPFDAAKGTRWTWRATSTDGKTTIDAVGTVTGTDVLTIGGKAVPVTVVDYVMTPSGDVTGTVHLTSWVSSAYRLIVKQHQVIDAEATAYGFTVPFTCDTTTTLTRLDPS